MHPINLFGVGIGDEPVGPHVLPHHRPTLEIARGGFGEQRLFITELADDVRIGKNAFPQLGIAAAVLLLEFLIFKQAAEPAIEVFLAADERIVPALGIPALEVFGIAPAEVVVPNRTQLELAVAVFVKESAKAVTIDLLGQLGHEVVVDKGGRVDISPVASLFIQEIRPHDGGIHFIEVLAQPVALFQGDLLFLRAHESVQVAAVERKPAFARPQAVFFKDVPPGDFRFLIVMRLQSSQVQPARGDLDALHQQINAVVVRMAQWAVAVVEEQLYKMRPWCVIAHIAGQLISQGVAHQRLIGVRPMQHPVVFFWHAQQGFFAVGAIFLEDMEAIAFLGERLRARAPDFDIDAGIEKVGAGDLIPSIRRFVDEGEVGDGLFVGADGLIKLIDDHQRQIGGKGR